MHKLLVSSLIIFSQFASAYGQAEKPIKLDYFKETPTEIDGCSGSFTYDSVSLKQEKYIVITNLQKLAFIRINGQTIKLTLYVKKHPSVKKFIESYKGGGYTMILTTVEGKQTGDETSLSSGTMEISNGSDKLIIKIHGEGGC